MKKLYYMNYYQNLGQKTRKYAEGLVVSDEEIKQVVHFSVDGETLTCTALVLNDVEDILLPVTGSYSAWKDDKYENKEIADLSIT